MIIERNIKADVRTQEILSAIKKVAENIDKAEFIDTDDLAFKNYIEPDLAYFDEDGDIIINYVIVTNKLLEREEALEGLDKKAIKSVISEFLEWLDCDLWNGTQVIVQVIDIVPHKDDIGYKCQGYVAARLTVCDH